MSAFFSNNFSGNRGGARSHAGRAAQTSAQWCGRSPQELSGVPASAPSDSVPPGRASARVRLSNLRVGREWTISIGRRRQERLPAPLLCEGVPIPSTVCEDLKFLLWTLPTAPAVKDVHRRLMNTVPPMLRNSILKVRAYGRSPHRRCEIICRSPETRDALFAYLEKHPPGYAGERFCLGRRWQDRGRYPNPPPNGGPASKIKKDAQKQQETHM